MVVVWQRTITSKDRQRTAALILFSLRNDGTVLTALVLDLLAYVARQAGGSNGHGTDIGFLGGCGCCARDYIARMVRLGRPADVLAGSNTIVESLLVGWLAHSMHPFLRDTLSEPVRS